MESNSKKNSIISLVIIFVLLFGTWKGSDLLPSSEISSTKKIEQTVQAAKKAEEIRAVWISYIDLQNAGVSKMSKQKFEKYINSMFSKCVKLKMNTVIVQVRPFGDAMYASKYFPWSVVSSGRQGKYPGYDPLKYMVKAAHKKGLEIHAWLNPYRVTLSGTNVKKLSKKNQARKWRASSSASKRRNVLTFDGKLYYNPAKKDVRNLIVNGVKEIVKNYNVDGVHFDDYFYPALGTKYKSNFDAKEYKAYKKKCAKEKKKAKSIIAWRRSNVDTLVKQVYQAVKKIDKNVQFGISPAGNMNNLYASDRYYVDVKKWMKHTGYVDYICPQIYWSFTNKYCPYKKTVKRWVSAKKNSKVDLYIGLAAYRAGISKKEARSIGDTGWCKSKKELKKQVVAARKYKKVSGFVFYSYGNMVSGRLKTEVKNLKTVLK